MWVMGAIVVVRFCFAERRWLRRFEVAGEKGLRVCRSGVYGGAIGS
jgi:hypothetical protein